MTEEKELTDEEVTMLKELAQNMISAGRVGRLVRGALIWLATALGAGALLWEFVLRK